MSMESLLSREFLRVVEEAAIAAARTMGQGDRKGSDRVAVEAMRKAMDTLPMRGTVVIGEGERDEAPMLYIGEKVGRGHSRGPRGRHRRRPARGDEPLRHRLARRDRRAGGVQSRRLLHAPDCYMEKIVVGPAAKGAVHLDAPVDGQPQGDRQAARPCRDGSGRHRPRPPAPREAHRGHPQRRRAHSPDQRRRSVRRHLGRRPRAPTCTR